MYYKKYIQNQTENVLLIKTITYQYLKIIVYIFKTGTKDFNKIIK